MQLIKSFISIAFLTDNSSNVTAPFGELSDYSRSFAKDKGRYSTTEYPDVMAHVFSSTELGATLDVSDEQRNDMLKVADYVSSLIKINGIPLDAGDLAQLIDDNLNIDDMTLINVDNIVTEGDSRCPDNVSWTSNNTRFIIWFHDESFRHQYLDFLIEVTMPLETVDDLLRSEAEVKERLYTIARLSQLQNDRPHDGVPTKSPLVTHTWFERGNPSVSMDLNFGLNAYGQTASSVDEQRKAIADHILANSSYNRIDWAQVFPSIFKTNEVYIIPAWDEISLENMTLVGSLYSPVLPINKALRIGNKYAFGYTTEHVNTHLETVPVAYKSLATVSIGSATNTNDQYSLRDTFPEYAFIHAHSNDYSSLPENTRDFMNKLYQVIILAEHFTLTSPIPSDISHIERNGWHYLTAAVDGLSMIVLTKLSYMEAEGYDYEPSKTYDFLGDHEC